MVGLEREGRLRSSQKMLKAEYKWILTNRATKESRQKHGGQGAILEDFLEEVVWSGATVVDILVVS